MTVMVGESVPELTRELGAAVLMAYGAATWDWHRLHYDQRYVEAHGADAPVVDGQMFGALCAQAIIGWLGPRAFVTKLGYKMRSMVFAGDTVRIEGEVSGVEQTDQGQLVTIEQRGFVGDRLAVQTTTQVKLPV